MVIGIDGRYIQDHFPGIGRYTYNLIDALARVAVDDSFVVLHNPALRNTRYDINALARHPNVELRRVNVPTSSLREQWAVGASTRHRPYVFHSPYFVKPYFSRVPSVVTIFDLIPLRFPQEMPNVLLRLTFRVAVALAARTSMRIIAPSSATRDDLISLVHVPREKIKVIPLGVDSHFSPRTEREVMRVREKYSLSRQYALTVGINKPHKNLVKLMQAWGRVESEETTLVIAGVWDERFERLRDNRIKWIRDIDDADLPALYSGASLFVMPSLYEGFGLPALEAMACGTPVIASNTSSIPAVVGEAGLLFDPRDANALAALITRLLNDRALQDDLRAKALERAARFSWERTARETLAVYREVIEQRRLEIGD